MFDADAIAALTEAQSITAAEEAIGNIGAEAIAALPSDFKLHDMEPYLPHRRRARGTMTTNTLSAFAAYVGAHNDNGSVFVKAEDMAATAVLNMGNPNNPGHCDNLAVLQLRKTAAYAALTRVIDRPQTQQVIAEFFEDWVGAATFFNENVMVPDRMAVAAIRRLTIEAINRRESAVQSLSADRTEFESVTAKSADTIPTLIYFDCKPYAELASRTFMLRLGILTGGKDPQIVLRVIKEEEHAEEMATEFAGLVKDALGTLNPAAMIPVMLGAYK